MKQMIRILNKNINSHLETLRQHAKRTKHMEQKHKQIVNRAMRNIIKNGNIQKRTVLNELRKHTRQQNILNNTHQSKYQYYTNYKYNNNDK